MFLEKELKSDLDDISVECPERRLMCHVINRAIVDASISNSKMLAWEAIDFLLGDRIDTYLELLDMDPEVFKDCLVKHMASYRSRRTPLPGDVSKRNFMVNYGQFNGKPFRSTIPREVLYGDRG